VNPPLSQFSNRETNNEHNFMVETWIAYRAGTVRVEGLGIVKVTQSDIDSAASAGGDPKFDLEESTRMGDKMHRYLLGLIR